jgi:hypothetical protein
MSANEAIMITEINAVVIVKITCLPSKKTTPK